MLSFLSYSYSCHMGYVEIKSRSCLKQRSVSESMKWFLISNRLFFLQNTIEFKNGKDEVLANIIAKTSYKFSVISRTMGAPHLTHFPAGSSSWGPALFNLLVMFLLRLPCGVHCSVAFRTPQVPVCKGTALYCSRHFFVLCTSGKHHYAYSTVCSRFTHRM